MGPLHNVTPAARPSLLFLTSSYDNTKGIGNKPSGNDANVEVHCMKIIMKKRAGEFFLTMAILATCVLPARWANASPPDMEEQIRNKAFTNPADKASMPPDWVERPIQYLDEAKGADLTIVLDQDIHHTFVPIIHRFATANKLKVFAKEATCGIAAAMLIKKNTDMGGFCCPPGKEDRLPGIQVHTIGIVAKAILVHPDNPLDNMSSEQVRQIFQGKISRWSELETQPGTKGPNLTIQPMGRFHCKTRPGHWYQLLPDEKMFSPLLHEVSSIPDMISLVSSNKDAIGWEVMSMANHYANLGQVKALKINNHPPTDKEAIATRSYPFYRTYNVTTWSGDTIKNDNARKLVDYLIKESANIDSRFGFVPSGKLRQTGWRFLDDELIGEP